MCLNCFIWTIQTYIKLKELFVSLLVFSFYISFTGDNYYLCFYKTIFLMSKFLGIRFVAFIICGLFVASPMQAHLRFDSLLIELDHVIANEKEYKSRKENYLEKLKEQLRNQNLSRESRYSIYQSLAGEDFYLRFCNSICQSCFVRSGWIEEYKLDEWQQDTAGSWRGESRNVLQNTWYIELYRPNPTEPASIDWLL